MSSKAREEYRADPREAELVEDMILDSMDYIFGKGSEAILEMMESSTDTSQSIATAAYKVVRSTAEKHKATAQVEMDMDMMLGVATECIDMVTEVAETSNQIIKGVNVQQIKEDALLKLTTLHGQQMEGEEGFTEEQQQMAATDLRDYMSDGGTQKGFDYVNKRATAEGLNPNDMMRAGNEAVFGTKEPVADAVAKGLMEQSNAAWDAAGQIAPVVGAGLMAAGQDEGPRETDLYASTPDEAPRAGINMLAAPADVDRGGNITPEQIGARANRQADLAFSAPPRRK